MTKSARRLQLEELLGGKNNPAAVRETNRKIHSLIVFDLCQEALGKRISIEEIANIRYSPDQGAHMLALAEERLTPEELTRVGRHILEDINKYQKKLLG